MVKIYIINIDLPVSAAQYEYWMSCISEEQRNRIDKFHFDEDRRRTLYGDILCRRIIGRKTGMAVDEIVFEKNSYGKPYVSGHESIHFNISHSDKWVVCAVAEGEVGVDIEKIKEIDLEIARRFFTPYEYKSIIKQPEDERLRSFYTIWTLKESYIKQIGKGLSVPLDSFEIVKTGGIYQIAQAGRRLVLRTGNQQGQYILSICHESDETFGGIYESGLQGGDFFRRSERSGSALYNCA